MLVLIKIALFSLLISFIVDMMNKLLKWMNIDDKYTPPLEKVVGRITNV